MFVEHNNKTFDDSCWDKNLKSLLCDNDDTLWWNEASERGSTASQMFASNLFLLFCIVSCRVSLWSNLMLSPLLQIVLWIVQFYKLCSGSSSCKQISFYKVKCSIRLLKIPTPLTCGSKSESYFTALSLYWSHEPQTISKGISLQVKMGYSSLQQYMVELMHSVSFKMF